MEIQHTVAFAAGANGGNPCPVVLGAEELGDAELQAIARDFGVECAFVLPSRAEGCARRLRYFTPGAELSMCGHATIAAVTVMVDRGLLPGSQALLETGNGPLPVNWERQQDKILVYMEQGLPELRAPVDPAAVCKALNITQDELGEGPIQAASTSRFKLMVPLKSRAVLDGLKPDFEALWTVCDQCGVSGLYPFAPGDSGLEWYARQFPCRTGYLEDPATGVSASALSGYLYLNHMLPDSQADGWHRVTVYQGQAMGRPSLLLADVFSESGAVTRTRLCGTADFCQEAPKAL